MKKTLLAAMAMVSLCGHAQLLNEGFETWPVSGWTTHSNGGTGITWQQADGSAAQPAYSGSHAAYLDKENVPDGTLAQDWMATNLVQIPMGNAAVTFASRLTIAGDQGSIYKLMLLPATGNPAILSDYVVLKQWTEVELNPVQTDYMIKNVAIPPAYSGAAVRFAFYMEGDDGDRWLVDEVGITSFCAPPTNLAVTNITLTSAELNWSGDASTVEIEVVSETAVPTGIGTIYNGPSPYTITGLLPGTGYKVYMRSTCADGGVSEWVGPVMFYNDTTYNNELHGVVHYDANDDGVCDENDTLLAGAAISVSIDGEYAYTTYTNTIGGYNLYGLEDGVHTLTLAPSIPGFPALPVLTEEVEFTEEVGEWNVSHCILQPEPFNNLGVNFYTYGAPRPGFDIIYYLEVRNLGSTESEAVTVTLEFDAARLDFVPVGSSFNGVVSGNTLTLTVGDIQALQQTIGNLKFHVKQPPVNIGGEVINFSAALSAVENDTDMTNNTAVYEDLIVNSYDPNDITVHEGAEIKENQVEDYLTYTIRFQNTGTAEAINIKLENTLDELLDWDTFEPIASSHSYNVKRTENLLEFEYDNIFLPDSTANEPGSHGHITYRIKPKSGFGLGDVVSNKAEIYFDFNEAIDTNTATTEVVATAGLNDNAIAIARLYPNPVKDQLHIAVNNGELQSVTIHDLNGRLCLSANAETIDINAFNSGIYFVKVTTDAGSANYKIVKQ